jgi:hypothetical protein
LRFVADQLTIFIVLFIQCFHGAMTFRPGCHLDKGKTFWLAGKMVHYQVGVDYFAKIAEDLQDFCFGDIIRQIAYKEFQTVAPWECDRQESFTGSKNAKLQ